MMWERRPEDRVRALRASSCAFIDSPMPTTTAPMNRDSMTKDAITKKLRKYTTLISGFGTDKVH
jgi:hypothetical protein